jgi:dienelactone hydrolase
VTRTRALVLILMVAAATTVALPARAEPPPTESAITTTTSTFVDTTRPTPCTGAPDRTLHVTVSTPGVPGPSPVVLVGPGSGASQRAVARADAAALAARGYVGVALDFPCTNAPGFSTTDPVVALDVYHQPADVSFVLTNLLALDATPGDPLFGLLDPDRVGMVGTSSGAVTALLFFNTCCTDARIHAVESVKGVPLPTPPGFPVSGDYDWTRPIATYLWNGCADPVIPYGRAADAYAVLPAPKAFVTDPVGTHETVPVFPPGTVDAFLDRFVAGDTSAPTLAPFLAAASDPYFAYDLGARTAPKVAEAGCASPPAPMPAPEVTSGVVVAPSFPG